jgi:hypothetical protein
MPSGANAEGKLRYRDRLQVKLLEEEAREGRAQVHPTTKEYNRTGTQVERLATRRAQYNSTGRRSYEAIADEYEHGGDFEGRIQQFQRTSLIIITLQVPAAYAEELMHIQDASGSMWFRCYIPKPPELIEDEEPDMLEVEVIDAD